MNHENHNTILTIYVVKSKRNELTMNIRRLFAVWSAHIIKTACRLTGKQGVTLAGKAALAIYPPILKELAKEIRLEYRQEEVRYREGAGGYQGRKVYKAKDMEDLKSIC